MKKKMWLWILLALLAALFVWRFVTTQNSKETEGRNGPQAVAVELAPVEIKDLTEIAQFSGNLSSAHKYILAPKIAGQLTKLHVSLGQKVRKGQLIAELDDVLYDLEAKKAAANVEQAQYTMQEAYNTWQQHRQLLEKKFISQDEYDRVYTLYNIEKAKHQAALNAYNTASYQLQQTKVTADWTGGSAYRVIGEKFAEEGQLVSVGTPLVSVLDISTLVAEINVIESDYRRIKLGQIAVISSDSWPHEEFTGRVIRIAPMLSEDSRQARVEIEIPNPSEKLKPGMYARIQINYQTKKQVTSIPLAALYKHKGEEGVFVVNRDSMNVSFVPVEKGISTNDFVEIIDPPLQGEVVILGQDQLDDGRKIVLPGEDKPAKGKAGRKQ